MIYTYYTFIHTFLEWGIPKTMVISRYLRHLPGWGRILKAWSPQCCDLWGKVRRPSHRRPRKP